MRGVIKWFLCFIDIHLFLCCLAQNLEFYFIEGGAFKEIGRWNVDFYPLHLRKSSISNLHGLCNLIIYADV